MTSQSLAPPIQSKKWYRAKEVASLCGLSEWQIRTGIRTGTIQATPHGLRSWLIPAYEVTRLCATEAPPPGSVPPRAKQRLDEETRLLTRLARAVRRLDAEATPC